ncbi:TolC family protein [Proteobacteria bacterium 005FR1]|nr:TolC family protein [Proteobacteria bacterium 005FR1]
MFTLSAVARRRPYALPSRWLISTALLFSVAYANLGFAQVERSGVAAPVDAAEDPIASASVMSADELAAWVLARNPGVQAAKAAARAAAFRIDPAGSLDDPTLSYGVAPNTSSSDRGLEQRVEIAQRFPWPGTLAARKEQARFEAIAAEQGTDVFRLEVAAAAKAAYAEWRYVASALTVHEATHDLLSDLISAAETRYAAGRASRQDVLQAQVERVEVENRKLRLQQLATTVRARINALLQRPPDAPLPAAAPIPLLPRIPSEELLEQFALEHPSLRRLASEVEAQQSAVVLAEKAFYPEFQVGVGYNELWDDSDKRATIGLSINVPLDRSKRHAQLDSAQAQLQSRQWALAEQRMQLLAELAQARALVLEARQTVELYEDQLVPLVDEYLESAIADYSAGDGSFLSVVTAEQCQLSTELGLARARADYVRALAVLERWVGGSLPEPAEGE